MLTVTAKLFIRPALGGRWHPLCNLQARRGQAQRTHEEVGQVGKLFQPLKLFPVGDVVVGPAHTKGSSQRRLQHTLQPTLKTRGPGDTPAFPRSKDYAGVVPQRGGATRKKEGTHRALSLSHKENFQRLELLDAGQLLDGVIGDPQLRQRVRDAVQPLDLLDVVAACIHLVRSTRHLVPPKRLERSTLATSAPLSPIDMISRLSIPETLVILSNWLVESLPRAKTRRC